MSNYRNLPAIREALLENRSIYGLSWPGLDNKDANGRVTLEGANLFFLSSINDYQQKVEHTYDVVHRFMYQTAPNTEEVWDFIVNGHTYDEWMLKKDEYGLHWTTKGHERNYRIAGIVLSKYNGDPRGIWEAETPGREMSADVVISRLMEDEMRCGDRISYMIVGALKDEGIISGTSDIKADTHVTKVLGRLFAGEEIEPEEAIAIARKIYPDDPWEIDEPLFILGKDICLKRNPKCNECYLNKFCEYKIINL